MKISRVTPYLLFNLLVVFDKVQNFAHVINAHCRNEFCLRYKPLSTYYKKVYSLNR